MKKTLTFIPLGVGISSAIIYVFNIFRFRIINNSATLLQILSNLKIYLYISIGGFLLYFFIKLLLILRKKEETKGNVVEVCENNEQNYYTNSSESFKIDNEENGFFKNSYVPNYDYVPIYKEKNEDKAIENNISEQKLSDDLIFCYNCGEKILNTDIYCRKCGSVQNHIKTVSSKFKKIINILEIVILILVLYFSLNMLFDYKEKKDPNFKSPFTISMTK